MQTSGAQRSSLISLQLIFFYYFFHLFLLFGVCIAIVHMWSAEKSLVELVLCLHVHRRSRK